MPGISLFCPVFPPQEELLKPYAEWRVPYRQPNVDELFSLLTGETEETLKKGQIVQVRDPTTPAKPPSKNVRVDVVHEATFSVTPVQNSSI